MSVPPGFAPVADDLSCCRAVPAGGGAQGAEAHGPVGDCEHLAVYEAVLDPHEDEVVRGYPFDAHRLSSGLIIGADSIGAIGGLAPIHRVGGASFEPLPGSGAHRTVFGRAWREI